MDLSKYQTKQQNHQFPSVSELFQDIESINNYLVQAFRSQDGPVLQSLSRDFLRLKTQFQALQRIKHINGTYEELFVKNGRAALQALLKNCIFDIWNDVTEAAYLNFCVEYYQRCDKSLLMNKYRQIDTNQEFRFFFQSDNGIDANLSLFITISLLQLNDNNDIEMFLEGQYREISPKKSNIDIKNTQLESKSDLRFQQIQSSSAPKQSSQIYSQIQNRLNSSQNQQDQTYLQKQLDMLREEQQQIVISATEKIDKYKQKLGQYRSLEKELSSKLGITETQNAVLKEELAGKNQRISQLQNNLNEIESNFQMKQQNNFQITSDYERLKSENERYMVDVKIYQERAESAQHQLKECSQELQSLRPLLLKSQSEASISQHLRQKLVEMNNENADLVQKYNSIVEQVKQLIQQQKLIQQDKQIAEQQVSNFLNDQKQSSQILQQNSEYQNQIIILQGQVQSLKEQLQVTKNKLSQQDYTTEIQEKSEQLSQKLTENLKLKERVAVFEAQIQSKQIEIQELTYNDNQKQQSMIQEIQSLQQKLQDIQNDIESTQFYKTQISQMKTEISSFQSQVQQKSQLLDDKNEDIGKLKLQIQALTADAAMQSKASELQDIIRKLKEQINQLENENTDIQKATRKLEIEVISSKGIIEQYEQLKTEYTEKCAQVNKQQSQIQELKQQSDQKTSDIELLTKQLDLGKEQLQQLTEQFNAIQESQETDLLTSTNASAMEQQLQEKDDIIRDLRDVASQYQNQAHALQDQLNNSVSHDRVTQLLEQTEKLTFKIKDLESENSELKKNSQDTDYFGHSLNPTQREIQLEKENKSLKNQLETYEFSGLQATQNSCFNCSQLKQQIEMKTHEIENIKDELDSTAQELEMLRDFRLKELENEIASLKMNSKSGGDDMIRLKLQHLVEDEIDGLGGLDYLDDEFMTYQGDKPKKNQEVERIKNKIKALIDM
ncbi:hypothetical protein SS50377_23209 [Spironucleus salmonicida]|uniref:Uncharacterized protein n=1 Tax=Spironucleus salmonicida TaxID=348837 RepID=V6LNY4_9EUKA|nr:hypothetical protein SS50377_23209 [Spironucleus salmonicida]|eukprot:EST46310.1 hypothetical protein SS50377_13697 [Spironucleus salmonicida]